MENIIVYKTLNDSVNFILIEVSQSHINTNKIESKEVTLVLQNEVDLFQEFRFSMSDSIQFTLTLGGLVQTIKEFDYVKQDLFFEVFSFPQGDFILMPVGLELCSKMYLEWCETQNYSKELTQGFLEKFQKDYEFLENNLGYALLSVKSRNYSDNSSSIIISGGLIGGVSVGAEYISFNTNKNIWRRINKRYLDYESISKWHCSDFDYDGFNRCDPFSDNYFVFSYENTPKCEELAFGFLALTDSEGKLELYDSRNILYEMSSFDSDDVAFFQPVVIQGKIFINCCKLIREADFGQERVASLASSVGRYKWNIFALESGKWLFEEFRCFGYSIMLSDNVILIGDSRIKDLNEISDASLDMELIKSMGFNPIMRPLYVVRNILICGHLFNSNRYLFEDKILGDDSYYHLVDFYSDRILLKGAEGNFIEDLRGINFDVLKYKRDLYEETFANMDILVSFYDANIPGLRSLNLLKHFQFSFIRKIHERLEIMENDRDIQIECANDAWSLRELNRQGLRDLWGL